MYAKLSNVEILSSYIKEISVGDILTVSALITNPLDWHHFYEKISAIRKGEKTDFMVVTAEGDRLVGKGDIVDMERWNSRGQYGFKIKISVRKQKSLTDRRTRVIKKPPQEAEPEVEAQARVEPAEVPTLVAPEATTFRDLLKGSLAMDISR